MLGSVAASAKLSFKYLQNLKSKQPQLYSLINIFRIENQGNLSKSLLHISVQDAVLFPDVVSHHLENGYKYNFETG